MEGALLGDELVDLFDDEKERVAQRLLLREELADGVVDEFVADILVEVPGDVEDDRNALLQREARERWRAVFLCRETESKQGAERPWSPPPEPVHSF